MGEKPTGVTEEEEGEGTSDTGGDPAGIVRRPDGTIRKATATHGTSTG